MAASNAALPILAILASRSLANLCGALRKPLSLTKTPASVRRLLPGELPGRHDTDAIPIGEVHIYKLPPSGRLCRPRVVGLGAVDTEVIGAFDVHDARAFGVLRTHDVEHTDGAHGVLDGAGTAHVVNSVVIGGAGGELSGMV